MLITCLDFEGILLETLILPNFVCKFWMCFFQSQALYWTYLRNGWSDWCEMKKGGAVVGYWVNYVTLIFDPTHDLDLVVSRSKFEIALFEEYGGGGVGVGVGGGWGVGWVGGGLIYMERKGCDSIIHDHDHDLWVTMVGWVDVPYSDRGDFRHRRAIDISSFELCCSYEPINPIRAVSCPVCYLCGRVLCYIHASMTRHKWYSMGFLW